MNDDGPTVRPCTNAVNVLLIVADTLSEDSNRFAQETCNDPAALLCYFERKIIGA